MQRLRRFIIHGPILKDTPKDVLSGKTKQGSKKENDIVAKKLYTKPWV